MTCFMLVLAGARTEHRFSALDAGGTAGGFLTKRQNFLLT
jgi:hypothetical protein